MLDRAVTLLSRRPHAPSLYAGYTGVAWAVAHLEGLLLDPGGEDPDEAIDEALGGSLDRSPWEGPYDLIDGLVGFGVYALERLPRPAAATCLRRVIERLEETAVEEADGLTWWSRAEWLGVKGRRQFPNGYYNLGLAHGTPGVIALLGAACGAGVASSPARRLLEGAVSWLLARQLRDARDARFPSFVGPGIEPAAARLAWCYGDLGVALALLSAARSAGEPSWEQEAIRTARVAASRPMEASKVIDAELCHGASGVAHGFNRLYQSTGDEEFLLTARRWYARTLEMRRPGEGAAGYLVWAPDAQGEPSWQEDRGLLTGVAGIGLALMAAISTQEPSWDRMLIPAPPAPRPGSSPP